MRASLEAAPRTRAADREEQQALEAAMAASLQTAADAEAAAAAAAATTAANNGHTRAGMITEQEQMDRAIALSLAADHDQHGHAPIESTRAEADELDELDDDGEMMRGDGGGSSDGMMEAGAAEAGDAARYELHSVVSHLGAHATSGHYIADVFDAEQQCWVRHNDSHVSVLRKGSVFSPAAQSDAYLLVYVLREPGAA